MFQVMRKTMSANFVSRRTVAALLLSLFLGMSMSPFSELWIENVEAAEVARHTYEFSDGTTEYIALYQGGNADSGAKISLLLILLGHSLNSVNVHSSLYHPIPLLITFATLRIGRTATL